MTVVIPEILTRRNEATALALLKAYFDPAGPYPGREFDFLGANDPYRITPEDLLALSVRGLPVEPDSILHFYRDTERREKITAALEAIDAGRCITDADGEVLLLKQLPQLVELWDLVAGIDGFDREYTSMLLSRKRPRLVPVYNDAVKRGLGLADGDDHWAIMVKLFADQDFKMRLIGLRGELGFNRDNMSLQRLFEVLLWMDQNHTGRP